MSVPCQQQNKQLRFSFFQEGLGSAGLEEGRDETCCNAPEYPVRLQYPHVMFFQEQCLGPWHYNMHSKQSVRLPGAQTHEGIQRTGATSARQKSPGLITRPAAPRFPRWTEACSTEWETKHSAFQQTSVSLISTWRNGQDQRRQREKERERERKRERERECVCTYVCDRESDKKKGEQVVSEQ